MNRYPTIFLTLKGIEGLRFESALKRLRILLAEWISNHMFLFDSDRISEDDKKILKELSAQEASYEDTVSSLKFLCKVVSKYYNLPVILLIDEYDVPLAKASENGYYTEMLDLIRAFLGDALKTNPYLKFAVVTGCLRISKESIFTGTNHFMSDDMSDGLFTPYIGFTEAEVRKMLKDLSLPEEQMKSIKEWYDGYLFGETEMYCPWSVLNHLVKVQNKPNAKPKAYWAYTSHNGIIYHFIKQKSINVQDDFETLMNDGTITTGIEENLTYDYLRSTVKNFWSLLYLTGYLTKVKENEDGSLELRIPNKEVKDIFKKSIVDWYESYVVTIDRNDIYQALWNKDIDQAQTLLSNLLFNTISYYDYQESYYHSFIAGLFSAGVYGVESNKEAGTGRPDIVIKDNRNRRCMVIEIKYAKDEKDISLKTKEGLKQFEEKKYLECMSNGYYTKIGYVMTFHGKDCFIRMINKQ